MVECPFEPAVIAAAAGTRLEELTPAIEQHVQACAFCAEVVQVAAMLRADHESVLRRARVPAAGQVWWRAVVRARLDAAHTVARPITWLQGATGACVLGAVGAVSAIAWPSLREALQFVTRLTVDIDPATIEAAKSLADIVSGNMTLVVGLAGGIVLAPIVALCYALSEPGD
jgi:hypothetical protein